jgi:hypothetical protein
VQNPGGDDEVSVCEDDCRGDIEVGRIISARNPNQNKSTCPPNDISTIVEDASRCDEKPSEVSSRSLGRVFLHFATLHLPPIATTFALLLLYCKSHYWYPDHNGLNAMLFAAKIHESWIVLSLSSILLHHIRIRLLDHCGVRFGFLTSSFQLGNPLYILGRSFLGASGISHPRKARHTNASDAYTAGLIVLTTLLALLAGPSSGIAMLPKFDWWPLLESHPTVKAIASMESDGDYSSLSTFGPLFINEDESEPMYPTDVKASMVLPICASSLSISYSNGRTCPGVSGIPILDRLATGFITPNLGADNFTFNTTLSKEDYGYNSGKTRSFYAKALLSSVSPGRQANETTVAQATSPLDIIADYIVSGGRDWETLSSYPVLLKAKVKSCDTRSRLRQPFVLVQCANTDNREGARLKDHPTNNFTFTFASGPQVPFKITLLKSDLSGYEDSTRFIPDSVLSRVQSQYPGYDSEEFSPISAAYVTNDTDISANSLDLCLMTAIWVETDVWVDLSLSKTPVFGGLPVQMDAGINNQLDSRDTIRLRESWLGLLMDTPTSLNSSAVYIRCKKIASGIPRACRASALAQLVADGLSRLQYHHKTYYKCPKPWAQSLGPGWYCDRNFAGLSIVREFIRFPNITEISIQYFHRAYSYQFQGVTVILAFSVLLTHVLIAFFHLWATIINDAQSSRAWSDLGELIALAFQSMPSSLLSNTGSGISSWKTWRLRAYVREVTAEHRLEFVLQDPRKLGPEAVGDSPVDGRLALPRPDRKYG